MVNNMRLIPENEYSVAGCYLSAIINGDYSGLTDDEEQELNNWLDDVEHVNGTHWEVSEESCFDTDEITGLLADCYTLIQYIYGE